MLSGDLPIYFLCSYSEILKIYCSRALSNLHLRLVIGNALTNSTVNLAVLSIYIECGVNSATLKMNYSNKYILQYGKAYTAL